MTGAPAKRGPPGGAPNSDRGAPRRPQQARSRRTRRALVEAAAAVFEERGYDETNTAEIARRAGVAVGTVYGYFPDKRAILLEIVHETVEQMAQMVLQRLDPELWREADLRGSIRDLIHTIFTTRELRPGLQRIVWERFFKDAEVRAALEAIEARILAAIRTLVLVLEEWGVGGVRDPDSAAFVIHTSVEWIGSRLILGGAGDADVVAAVETTTDMIAGLILDA
jgi:AcrR family transcriptional regulator